MPNKVENDAIEVATKYLEKEGYTVQNVSRGKGRDSEHRGYDLVADKDGARIKIEVKGCTRPWNIPDPYATEFDDDHRLVADFLYVVYFINEQPVRLCGVPRDAFKPEDITKKLGYRISSRFKNKKSLEPYLREL